MEHRGAGERNAHEIQIGVLLDLLYEEAHFASSGVSEVLQQSRIQKRMRGLGFGSFEGYLQLLRESLEERQQAINLLTINETYFFRDYDQLANFAEEVLPLYASPKNALGDRQMRVLCGACSSGEEAYTLAIILKEMLDESPWLVQVDGVDINTEVLERARAGCYAARSLRDLPILYKSKYFEESEGGFKICEEIKQLVHFEHANLVAPGYSLPSRHYDFVFCRNLFLYLDANQREQLVRSIYRCLLPGGFFFLGTSESIGGTSKVFKLVKIGSQYVYQKE